MLSSVIEIHVSVTLWQLMFYLISFGGFVKGVLSLNLLCFLVSGAILGRSETRECVLYNYSPLTAESRGNRSGVESCVGEKDKRRHCFATWRNVSGSVEIVKQGCWLDDINCYDR